jgi:hypothetical protein
MMKHLLISLTGICLCGILYAGEPTQLFKPKLQIGSELSIDKLREQNLNIVQKAVEGIRETLPQKVDDYTQIVAIDSNGTKLIYTFEVQSGPQSDETMKAKGRKMTPRIQEGICMSSKRFLQADITIRYRYISSATKSEILSVDVNKSSCTDRWQKLH